MKRFHFFLLIGVAAALAACQKQNVINEPAEKDGSYVFTLKATADVITKTDFDAEGTFSWTAGDAISVLFNNGTTNKFFTLTTEGSGASADFSGTIDAGYTIGALDDGTKWAFYPAGSHTYTSASDIKFNIPALNDFTAEGAHWSSNMPMYAQSEDGSTFAFKHLGPAFKFTVKDLDNSVNKIKVVIQNQETYQLSGDIVVAIDGGKPFLDHGWADVGSTKGSLTFICNVSSNSAVFYVPVRYWGVSCFQPVVTIYNAENDAVLKEITAKNAAATLTSRGEVQPITISAPGAAEWSFESAFGIEWDKITDVYAGDGERILEWKATSDADNVYFYYKMPEAFVVEKGVWGSYLVTGFDTDNDASTGEDGSYGLGAGFEARSVSFPFNNEAGQAVIFRAPDNPKSDNNIKCPISGSSLGKANTNGTLHQGDVLVEIKIPRNMIGSPASGATIRVRQSCAYTVSDAQTITLK